MKNKTLKVRHIAFLAGILGLLCVKNNINAAQVSKECTGLELPTKEEEEFLNSIPVIDWVNLNEDALEIIKKENKNLDKAVLEKIKIADVGEECVMDQSATSKARQYDSRKAQREAVSQIKVYDVSENDTFPAIGDQGSTGSCTAWSM